MDRFALLSLRNISASGDRIALSLSTVCAEAQQLRLRSPEALPEIDAALAVLESSEVLHAIELLTLSLSRVTAEGAQLRSEMTFGTGLPALAPEMPTTGPSFVPPHPCHAARTSPAWEFPDFERE